MALTTFDSNYYLQQNPDVLTAILSGAFESAEQHYTLFGEKEFRQPNPYFNPQGYYTQNPDVVEAIQTGALSTALEHFELFGVKENRQPGADTYNEQAYLSANPDVASAVAAGTFNSGYEHFVLFGAAEGRASGSEPTPEPEQSFVLTQRADNITGDAADNVFLAPVTQNETGSGELANTFETGDVLDGGAGRDVLRADLIDTGTIQDGVAGAAISATTTSIEEVYLRAQRPGSDLTIDAEKMEGVEQWWTDNSRADIVIEDIRAETAATTFGMRETDPGVSYVNYFNVKSLEGDVSATSAMTLNIYEGPLGAPNTATELENISVREIDFTIGGEQVTLDTANIRAANTWAELETALTEALAAIPGAETITIANRGNGQFVFEDSVGREFEVNEGEALVLSVTNNITVTNSLAVGREEVTGPIVTNAVLDGAGNGSQGGALNIGAMSGLQGIEVLNVDVDRDSHLTSIASTNLRAPNNGQPNEFLQVVNLDSIGANGDLQVGARTVSLDGRANVNGLVNVREVNGADFAGSLNLGISLDNNTIGRYLDSATEAVDFVYTGSAQDDLFNVQVAGAVAADQDFALDVDMGAGDDRLIINVPTARATSVDGGEGENSIVVSQSHGTNAANTFAGFANFQTYEVEGTGSTFNPITGLWNWNVDNTAHNFASMSGVANVIIATDGNSVPAVALGLPTAGDNTQLIALEADQDVTVSGKNQTIGNNSTNNQLFGTIQLTNDTGVDRSITLDNTARLSNLINDIRQDGVLTVATLTIDETATGNSATANVTIDSAGERNVANAVGAFNGRDVATLDLVGTQDLTFNIAQIADQAAAAGVTASTALDIDGSALEGELNLAITGAMIGNWGTATGLTDRIVGTSGDSDTLMLWGAQGNDAVTVTGFETIQFGNAAGGNMFGDLSIGSQDATGIYNAQNTAATNYVIADDIFGNTALTLNNLGSGVTVTMGDANRNAAGNVVNSQVFDDTITLNSGAVAGTPAAQVTVNYLSNIIDGSAHTLNIGTVVPGPGTDTNGYQTINIDVAHAANLTAAGNSTGSDVRVLNLNLTEDARVLNLTGGADNSGFRDAITFGAQLPNGLTKIDLSGYEGDVTLTMEQGAIAGATQTDVRFVMSEDDANITLSNLDGSLTGAAGVQHNSIFEFTGAKSTTDVSVWTISNVVGANSNDGTTSATTDNITRFDLTDLGITSFDQLSITTVSVAGAVGEVFIRSEAQDDATILTGTAQNTWEIAVSDLFVGVMGVGHLTADNFIFA